MDATAFDAGCAHLLANLPTCPLGRTPSPCYCPRTHTRYLPTHHCIAHSRHSFAHSLYTPSPSPSSLLSPTISSSSSDLSQSPEPLHHPKPSKQTCPFPRNPIYALAVLPDPLRTHPAFSPQAKQIYNRQRHDRSHRLRLLSPWPVPRRLSYMSIAVLVAYASSPSPTL